MSILRNSMKRPRFLYYNLKIHDFFLPRKIINTLVKFLNLSRIYFYKLILKTIQLKSMYPNLLIIFVGKNCYKTIS